MAFPEVKKPTAFQQKLLGALSSRRSIVANSLTGSGKSFAMALGMLNLDRMKIQKQDGSSSEPILGTTCICLVPTPDLADQYGLWMTKILNITEMAPATQKNIFQILYRGSPEEEKEQIKNLSLYPHPHVLICTPKRMLDILQNPSSRNLLELGHIRTLVVDEADAVIEPPDSIYVRQQPAKEKKHKYRLVFEKRKHVPPGVMLVNSIFKGHKSFNSISNIADDSSLQLICISATANAIFWRYVEMQDWLKPLSQNNSGKLILIGLDGFPDHTLRSRVPKGLDHHLVRASLTEETHVTLKNERIPYLPPDEIKRNGDQPPNITAEENNILPFSMSYVASSAAAKLILRDRISRAIVFIPPGSSRHEFVQLLKYFGVKHAKELRMKDDVGVSEAVWITHYAASRGLDLPNISHAFIIRGELARGRDYIHMAGRLGRMGAFGRVITILATTPTRSHEDVDEELRWVVKKMLRVGANIIAYFQPNELVSYDLKTFGSQDNLGKVLGVEEDENLWRDEDAESLVSQG